MNFKEYNASQITPQMTLLNKFNKLIKWLTDNTDKFFNNNIWEIIEDYTEGNSLSRDLFAETDEKELKVGDLILFENCYYAFITALSNDTVYFNDAVNFKGDKGDKGDSYLYKHTITLKDSEDNDVVLTVISYYSQIVSDIRPAVIGMDVSTLVENSLKATVNVGGGIHRVNKCSFKTTIPQGLQITYETTNTITIQDEPNIVIVLTTLKITNTEITVVVERYGE